MLRTFARPLETGSKLWLVGFEYDYVTWGILFSSPRTRSGIESPSVPRGDNIPLSIPLIRTSVPVLLCQILVCTLTFLWRALCLMIQ